MIMYSHVYWQYFGSILEPTEVLIKDYLSKRKQKKFILITPVQTNNITKQCQYHMTIKRENILAKINFFFTHKRLDLNITLTGMHQVEKNIIIHVITTSL